MHHDAAGGKIVDHFVVLVSGAFCVRRVDSSSFGRLVRNQTACLDHPCGFSSIDTSALVAVVVGRGCGSFANKASPEFSTIETTVDSIKEEEGVMRSQEILGSVSRVFFTR